LGLPTSIGGSISCARTDVEKIDRVIAQADTPRSIIERDIGLLQKLDIGFRSVEYLFQTTKRQFYKIIILGGPRALIILYMKLLLIGAYVS
jgi:hypothetical protein